MKHVLRVLFWFLGVPVLFIFLACSYLVYKADYAPYRGKKFTKEAWRYAGRIEYYYGTGGRDHESERCGMYTDLVENHIKKGMTLAEVENLIGETELVSYCMAKEIKCLTYSMGTCYGGSWTLSHGWFEVCLDKVLKVVSTGRSGNNREYIEEICDKNYISSCGLKSCSCHFKESILPYQPYIDCPFDIYRW